MLFAIAVEYSWICLSSSKFGCTFHNSVWKQNELMWLMLRIELYQWFNNSFVLILNILANTCVFRKSSLIVHMFLSVWIRDLSWNWFYRFISNDKYLKCYRAISNQGTVHICFLTENCAYVDIKNAVEQLQPRMNFTTYTLHHFQVILKLEGSEITLQNNEIQNKSSACLKQLKSLEKN